MLISERAIAEARHEILQKSSAAIELDTSKKWAARALAAYAAAAEDADIARFAQACDFHHEAVEHASGVSPTFLANIVALLSQAQTDTIGIFEGSEAPHGEESP